MGRYTHLQPVLSWYNTLVFSPLFTIIKSRRYNSGCRLFVKINPPAAPIFFIKVDKSKFWVIIYLESHSTSRSGKLFLMAFRGLVSSLTTNLSAPPYSACYKNVLTITKKTGVVSLAETKKEARQFLIWYNKTLRASHVRQDDQSLDVITPPFFQEVNYPIEVSGIEPD